MASEVLSALELDKEKMNGKLVLVKEVSGCESNFIFSSLLAKQIKDNGAICLVTLHNNFLHYHNVGLKMGYNLNNLKESGTVKNIDCLNLISESFTETKEGSIIDLISDKKAIFKLFELVKTTVISLLEKNKSICIIIDDLTHFFNLGVSINDINMFIQHCRSLVIDNIECSLVCGVHVVSEDDPSFMIAGLISHMADLICEVSGLKTGRSKDVSGSMKIIRPTTYNDCATESNQWTKLDSYHFKLFDRGIKVFAPGT